MRWRLAPALGLALSLVVGAADHSSAAWSVGGSGNSRAQAAVQQPPSAVTVTWDPTVHVSWVASSSAFTTGYRVSRSVSTSGPWTQFADVPAGTTTVDDTPGAGTWYYRVHAYRGAWTSSASSVVARTDPTYVVTGGTASGTDCPSLAYTYAMRQGVVPSGPGVISKLDANSPTRLCTDAFTDGQALPAGTTTVTAYVENTHHSKVCGITLAVSVNALVSLGSTVVSIPGGTTTASPQTWTVSTTGVSFATGNRINVRLTPDNGCGATSLYVAGASTPTRVTLPG